MASATASWPWRTPAWRNADHEAALAVDLNSHRRGYSAAPHLAARRVSGFVRRDGDGKSASIESPQNARTGLLQKALRSHYRWHSATQGKPMHAFAALDSSSVDGARPSGRQHASCPVSNDGVALQDRRSAACEQQRRHHGAELWPPFALASVRQHRTGSGDPATHASAVVARICAIEGFELWLGRLSDDIGHLPVLRTPLAAIEGRDSDAGDVGFFAAAVRGSRRLCVGATRATPADSPFDAVLADATVRHLASSLAPALRAPHAADIPFVQFAAAAMQAHIAAHPALAPFGERRRGGLAAWQLRLAREMLLASVDQQVPLPELAAACRLSVSHFVRAFGQSTGLSPHRWIVERRIEMSKDLLTAGKRHSLADVALRCGFSDQSHFTRSFSRAAGITPGAWRRIHAGDGA
jgi:AraC-like DNA-binding protein